MIIKYKELEIEITKKKVKNINLRINPDGAVKISAPQYINKKQIESFVAEKYDWIISHKRKIENKAKAKTCVENNNIFFLFGKPFELVTCENYGKNTIILKNNTVYICFKNDADLKIKEKLIYEFYKNQLTSVLNGFIEKWEEITKLYSSGYKIKNMKTRWGSCNTETYSLNFNLQLAKKDYDCIEYVVLHELCHIKVPNHSKDFKDLMTYYMPDWKQIKVKLNS